MKRKLHQHRNSLSHFGCLSSAFCAAVVVLCWLPGVCLIFAADPVMRVVKTSASDHELIGNGDFESASGDKLANWAAGPKGFAAADGQGRNGSKALFCDNPTGNGWYGASQTIVLNRTDALPLIVRGWSKASDISGSSDSDYSLYVDLVYLDGTPLWGQTANFHAGTHDWERRELMILPEKPVKSLTLNCLFRNHSGKAWFDEVSVTEIHAPNGTVLFQGVPVMPEETRTTNAIGDKEHQPRKYATLDGLSLALRDNTIVSLHSSATELVTNVPSGFLARDVASDSDFYRFEGDRCPELDLKLNALFQSLPDRLLIEGRVSDTRGKDRAITLLFALPLDAVGWRWGDDIRHSRVIEGQGEFIKSVRIPCGATGTLSLYPLGAIWSEDQGIALAIDMARPAQYRLGYHAGTKQFFIAYDFGLVPETAQFPSSADFRFILYRFDPRWGFRAAFEKLTRIFPEYFAVRSRDQGLWMPFTDIATVQGWEDFGFKYHEGNNNVTWDDAHGVLSFRYTEPMTWWMRMPNEVPRTLPEAVGRRTELARGAREQEREMAKVCQAANMLDQNGEPCLLFRKEPWCNGAVWSLNPNPHLPGAGTNSITRNAATVHWNETIREALYGSAAKGQQDGEYLDSLEGYVTADLNFRRDHFRYTTVPVSFSRESRHPALFKGLAVFEFTHWLCDQVHGLGKLTFANGVPYRFTYLCPWLDVLGTETDWVRNGRYVPASDEQMSLWRTMSGGKPYLLLMNTDYDVFTPEMVERYFQRSLFYGMFPGMFSHNAAENPYWQNPKWYNRDRPLFKKYLPLIKRVAEAGWQPVTCAECDNPRIFVERFGPDQTGTLFITLFNDTNSKQDGKVSFDSLSLGLGSLVSAREVISTNHLAGTGVWPVSLEPQEAKVVEVMSKRNR
jgi:hypothetical protein